MSNGESKTFGEGKKGPARDIARDRAPYQQIGGGKSDRPAPVLS